MTSFYAIMLFIIVFIAMMVIASLSTPKKIEFPDNLSDAMIEEEAINGEKEKAIQWYQKLHHVRPKEAKKAINLMLNK